MPFKNPLRPFRFSTRLGLLLTAILFLAAFAQTVLYFKTRDETVMEAEASYQTLAKAIEVAATQIGPDGWKDPKVLADYRDKLQASGLRDIQVTEAGRPFSETLPVISPGSKKKPPKPQAMKEILITGVVGDGTANSVLQLPLVVEGRFLGWVRIAYSLENIREIVAENFRRRLYALLGVFALGLAVMLVTSRDLIRPIERIAEAAGQVAEGDLSVKVPVDRADEIGQLAVTFNRMTEKLKERQELETRLIRAEKRAEIGHLASGLAHEIKNPLNSLSLGLDVLRRRHSPADPSAATDYTTRIQGLRSEIDRLASLINSFLAFGRPLALNRANVAIAEVVRSCLEGMEETASRAHITFEPHIEDEPGEGPFDGSLLKSVIWNLMQNGIQAMERSGGTLAISLRRMPPVIGPGEEFELVIEDTGPGIAPTDLQQLFEPYFSRKEGGVGLGLAMTRRIVEEHGGRIWAENRDPGPGARFIVRLAAHGKAATSGNLAA
jgi:signal transduction histidine kinase